MQRLLRYFQDADVKKLARDSSWLAARNVIEAGGAFLQGVLLARYLGIENFGLLALVTGYTVVVNQVIDFRVFETATRYVAKFWSQEKRPECLAVIKLCYLIDGLTGALAFLIILASSEVAARFLLHDPHHAHLLRLYGISLLFLTMNNTSSAILGVFSKFKWLSMQAICATLVKLLLVVAALLANPQLDSVLVAFVIASCFDGLTMAALAALLMKRTFNCLLPKGNLSLIRNHGRELCKFLLHTNLNELLTLMTKNIDILILGYFTTPVQTGYYRMAKMFSNTLALLATPVYTAVFPTITKLWTQGEREKIKKLTKKISFGMATLLLPACLLLSLLAPWILELTVGHEFIPAASAIRIMVWGVAIGGIFLWARPVILAAGRTDIPLYGNILGALSVGIFSFLMVPSFGYLGSAAVFVLPWLIGHIMVVGFIYRYHILSPLSAP